MSVFKRFEGKIITSKHPRFSEARWYISKRVNGQRIYKVVPLAQTKAQAELALRHEIEKLFNAKYGVADSSTTFQKFVDTTYTKYVEQNNVNKKAKEFYCTELKKHFGRMLMTAITPQDCRDYQYKRQKSKTRFGEPYAPASVNREMSTLSKIFALACEEGIIDRNPTQHVKQLKEPPPRKRILTDEQKAKVLDEIVKDRFLYRFVTLALNLPVRRGQILAIEKKDVDLEKKLLRIIASKGREARYVHLNRAALDILTEMSAESKGRLFLHRGKPVKDIGKRWRNMLIRAGVNKEGGTREENYHLHDIRLWFSQRLLKRNIHSKTIQGLFGHSHEAITDIYINVDPLLSDALDSLDDNIMESEGVN